MSATITIKSLGEINHYMQRIESAAKDAHSWIAQQTEDPLTFLRRIKFEKKGLHPITGHRLNLIEQINQTWTYAVALKATEQLFGMHPDADGFTLAPGAIASQELDIMSRNPGLVAAETFAATTPDSNRKLLRDLTKLSALGDRFTHRYVFFAAPTHPEYSEIDKYRRKFPGIRVYSVQL